MKSTRAGRSSSTGSLVEGRRWLVCGPDGIDKKEFYPPHQLVEVFFSKSFQNFSSDFFHNSVKTIQAEIRKMMKERNVSFYGMAKAIGVDRGSLHKSLKDGSNLELKTMMKVLDYLGYEIRFIKSRRKEVKSGKSNLSKEKGKRRR